VSIMKHYPKPGTITEELLQLNQNKGFGEKWKFMHGPIIFGIMKKT
jgi:hypothetical protein